MSIFKLTNTEKFNLCIDEEMLDNFVQELGANRPYYTENMCKHLFYDKSKANDYINHN